MNEADDAERQQRKLDRVPSEPRRSERMAFPGHSAGERAFRLPVVIDLHRKPLAWHAQGEVEGHVDVRKRRHVKMLWLTSMECSGFGGKGIGPEQERFHLVECIRDLCDSSPRLPRGVVAKVKRHGVESIAGDARQGDKQHAAAGQIDDLAQIWTWNGLKPMRKLSFVCKRLGIAVDDSFTGADMGKAVAEERWADVASHVLADIDKTTQVAIRLNVWR